MSGTVQSTLCQLSIFNNLREAGVSITSNWQLHIGIQRGHLPCLRQMWIWTVSLKSASSTSHRLSPPLTIPTTFSLILCSQGFIYHPYAEANTPVISLLQPLIWISEYFQWPDPQHVQNPAHHGPYIYKMSRISYANVETVMLFRFRKNGGRGLEWKTDEQNRVHFWVDKNTLNLTWQLYKSANKLKSTELYNLHCLIIPCEIHINKVFFKKEKTAVEEWSFD